MKVSYRIKMPATISGTMEVPDEIWKKSTDEMWPDGIEAHIAEMHDYLHNPPELDTDDADAVDIRPAQDSR